MYQKAVELAEANGWFLARQFETKANADDPRGDHGARDPRRFRGRAARLLRHRLRHRRHRGRRGRVLRRERPETQDHPQRAGQRAAGRQRQAAGARADGAPAASHPAFEPHPIQGWTPDFIPLVLQEAIDKHYYDELVPIAGAEGMKWAQELAQKEGIFTGISGGSTFAVALQVAEKAPAGSVILCMLPDTGERYLTTPLFDGIEAEMNEEEMALSRSTPGFQFPAA